MEGRADLDPEELDRLGGAALVLPYRASAREALTWSAMLAFASALGFGSLVVLLGRGVPWERMLSVDGFLETVHFQTVGAGYLCLWTMVSSHTALLAYRWIGASPGLVAGARGLRVHGRWPRAQHLAWDEVGEVSLGEGALRVARSPQAPPLGLAERFSQHFFGEPWTVRVPGDVDLEAARAGLERLRGGGA